MANRTRSILASVLFSAFGGPGILLFLLPWWTTRFRVPPGLPHWQASAAAVLIAAGLIPLLESIVRFVVKGHGALVPNVPTERLVVSGLYRFVRNPMYLGVFAVLAGETLLFRSRGILLELALVCMGMELFVRLYEEPALTRRFGDEYRRYCAQVPRWVPRLKNFPAEGSR